MPIQVACQCGQRFAAKDELAGKTVKCPKCGAPLAIPGPAPSPGGFAPQPYPQQPYPQQGGYGQQAPYGQQGAWPQQGGHPQQPYGQGGAVDPYGQAPATAHQGQTWLGTGAASSGGGGLGDLFDEAGMSSPQHTGPRCPGCAAPMRPDAIICVQCGYNMALGRRMETIAGQDIGSATPQGETAKLMAKAQQEVAEAPPAEEAGDFGEGASAYVLSCGMIMAVTMFLVVGGLTMYLFDRFVTNVVSPPGMLLISGLILMNISWIWMTIHAFAEKTMNGVLMLLFGQACGGLPMMVYGFMKMDQLLWPLLMAGAAYVMLIGGVFAGGM